MPEPGTTSICFPSPHVTPESILAAAEAWKWWGTQVRKYSHSWPKARILTSQANQGLSGAPRSLGCRMGRGVLSSRALQGGEETGSLRLQPPPQLTLPVRVWGLRGGGAAWSVSHSLPQPEHLQLSEGLFPLCFLFEGGQSLS